MTLPVRARMTLWYVGLLAVIITVVGAFLVVRLRADLISAIDSGLGPDAAQIADGYRSEGVPELADVASTVLTGERAVAQALSPGGNVATAYGDRVARAPMISGAELNDALGGTRLLRTRRLEAGGDEQDFRLVTRTVTRAGARQVVVAGQSLEAVEESVRRLVVLLLIAGPAALLATAAGGWWLAGRALRPVAEMTTTAEAIGVERLDERVPVPPTRDELADLALTLNAMLDRVQGGVEDQRRLVADASHELRTPLAAMRAEIDVSLRADDLGRAAREVLVSAREEVDRLSRTVDDLLTLAELDDAGLRLRPVPADLAAIVADVLDGLRPLAKGRAITLAHRGGAAPAIVEVERIGRALRNLVENAIAFSPDGGTVSVTTATAGTSAMILVADAGPGIPPAERERVFERFRRSDASRTRSTGGSGLGLAITREIVRAHGGTVRVEPRDPGSAFVVTLPSSASPATAGRTGRT